MCGIAGAASIERGADLRAFVGEIVAHQHARGPDVTATSVHDTAHHHLVLGHNRLSVIDLRPEANQPMADAHNSRVIVYNGEVYNYIELRHELAAQGVQFRTQSDTEVILAAYHAWGDAAFDRFIGMFALAIHDAREETIVLARDRFGVKPVYYWTDGRMFAFASTPTVLARRAKAQPNIAYVSRGIRYKFYEDDTSISPYENVLALEPSHILRVRLGGSRIELEKRRYYDLAAQVRAREDALRGASAATVDTQLETLFRSACTLRQRSDVTLGVSVSGGIDSSAVTAIVSETTDVIGYTFGHPDDRTSEAASVVTLSKATRLKPRFVTATQPGEIAQLFRDTLQAQDAPFPNVSIMAQFAVFKAARADGTIVLLGGQGGDEAFMGYRKFFLFAAQELVRTRNFLAAPRFLLDVIPLAPSLAARATMFVSERKRYARGGEGMGSRLVFPDATEASMGMAGDQTLQQRQLLDVTRYSLPTLLRYEDRNSMGNSIESRLPFLDHRIIEFGLALPTEHKLGNGYGKLALRRMLRGKVPDEIRLNRDKRGFDVGQDRWISSGLGAELRRGLEERATQISEFLPRDATVASLFSDQQLIENAQAFKEAVSLLWLASRM